MNEIIFGTMSTHKLRAEQISKLSAGVKHLNRIEPRVPQAGDRPQITVSVELDRRVERVICHLVEPEQADIPLARATTGWDMLNWTYYEVFQAELPAFPDGTLVRYRITACTASGEAIPADDGETFSYLVGPMPVPEWAESAIIYQVFPDRFSPGKGREWNKTRRLSDIFGGTIRGIIDHLDYIAGLGFNALWLNPFFPDQTHHGYHATDYFAVNPRMGTMDDIRELVDTAHGLGMRLILDFVANHWGSCHATFQEALKDRDSDFVNWYYWKKYPTDYLMYFTVKDLPKVNVDYPAARQYLLDSACFWLKDVGFDGLRLDHANGPSHDFWTALRAAVLEARPDAWIFGEVVESPVQQLTYAGRFHGCLDFVLVRALRDLFGYRTIDLAAFDALLDRHDAFFPPGFNRPAFLDNHDMDRFLLLAGGDRRWLKLASLCLFTLPGQPIVYYGTEAAVPQERSKGDKRGQGMEEARQPMIWGEAQDAGLREYFRWLVHFRREHPALRRGIRRTLHLDSAAQTYVYARSNASETVIVALNLGDEPRTVEVDDPVSGARHTFSLEPVSGDVRVVR